MKKHLALFFTVALSFLFHAGPAPGANPQTFESIGGRIGNREAFVIAAPEGERLYSKNAGKPMTPASTIKILTSLAAFHYLGKDYRFPTEFYLDSSRNLTIKGYGDPLLISEEVAGIARDLAPALEPSINEIIVNDSFFELPPDSLEAAGTSQPYGAPNGALCVNFNTVNYKKAAGAYLSAERQTPLLPFALEKIRKSGETTGRIVLSHNENDISLYAGHMFRYFLEKNGVKVRGKVWRGWLTPDSGNLIHKHESSHTTEQIARKLLEFSNNFMANQLLLAIGAKKHGPPGTFEKGAEAVKEYAKEFINQDEMTISEGSGLSRKNRISAETMIKILERFKPHHRLLKTRENAYYKTGTLRDVNNIAGYIENENGLYPFVIFINRAGKNAMPILDALIRDLKRPQAPGRR